MSETIDLNKLIRMIKSKRNGIGLRATASDIGISAPTLSRIENGKLPDLDTYSKICKWLNVGYDYFSLAQVSETHNREYIVASLRADRTLDTSTANSLINMINLAYNQIDKDK